MKTSDLIKQAEELLGKCSEGPWVIGSITKTFEKEVFSKQIDIEHGVLTCWHFHKENTNFIVFARNHMQELLDKLKKYEEALIELLGWQSMAPTDIIENARKALDYEGK